MHESPAERDVQVLITPTVGQMGFRIVRVKMLEGDRRTLQIMIEREDGGQLTVDDCAEVSHTVSALLDVNEIVTGAYRLEISSPGLDRPLTREEDFARYAGHEIKLETVRPIENRRRFRGILGGIEDDTVLITVDGQPWHIPYAQVQSSKLVLTDALLKSAQIKQETM